MFKFRIISAAALLLSLVAFAPSARADSSTDAKSGADRTTVTSRVDRHHRPAPRPHRRPPPPKPVPPNGN